jgi:hypothetical protein
VDWIHPANALLDNYAHGRVLDRQDRPAVALADTVAEWPEPFAEERAWPV